MSQDQWLAYALDSDDSCESEQAASLMLLQTSRCSVRQLVSFIASWLEGIRVFPKPRLA